MATPQSVDAQMDEAVLEHDLLWRRALSPNSPGGTAVVACEATLLYGDFRARLRPPVHIAVATLRVYKALGDSGSGPHGHRFKRHVQDAWANRPDNIVDFPGREEDDDSAA